ncbi:UNVERIFIED_CONTAM: hypothetical protein FKN15_061273 [Acipenser sinensis]
MLVKLICDMYKSQEERLAFLAEWYDPNAALLRQYQFLFYPKDRSVEMFDVKNHRTFLRRTKYEDIKLQDLFVGNRLNVLSRQLHLIEYGDQYTANKLGSRKEKTQITKSVILQVLQILIYKPTKELTGKILNAISDAGFEISALQMFSMDRANAEEFYEIYKGVVAEYT